MVKSYEVLNFLIPNGGYAQVGEEYEGITFIDCEPITKEQYEAGFVLLEAAKKEKELAVAAAKEAAKAKLAALGLTAEEIAALTK